MSTHPDSPQPMRQRDYLDAALAAVRVRTTGDIADVANEMHRRGIAGDLKHTRETLHATAAVGALFVLRYAESVGRSVDAVLDEVAIELHSPMPWETE